MSLPRNIYQRSLRRFEYAGAAGMAISIASAFGWAAGAPWVADVDITRILIGACASTLVWSIAGVLSRVPQDD